MAGRSSAVSARPDLAPHATTRVQLTRTDPGPRVRHRADALVLVADGLTLTAAAQLLHTSACRVRARRARLLVEGRDGLADRPRRGRPTKLDGEAGEVLSHLLTRSPLDEGYPVTTWIVTDRTDALGRRGWQVSSATVYYQGVMVRGVIHELVPRCRYASVQCIQTRPPDGRPQSGRGVSGGAPPGGAVHGAGPQGDAGRRRGLISLPSPLRACGAAGARVAI